MKFLGRGWQYTTYDLGSGRVLKKCNSRLQGYYIMLHDSFPYIKYPIWEFPKYFARCRNEAKASLSYVGTTSLPPEYMGNPKLLPDCGYEQDLVTPLRQLLYSLPVDESKKLIDDFVAFNKILIRYSLVDRNFLITDNFGKSKNGQIILTDLGELYADPNQISKHISTRPWTSVDVINSLPATLREYFVTKMDQAFLKTIS